jgi:hypothetical protein
MAETPVQGTLARDGEGYLGVPEQERRRCEEVIEAIANLIAVSSRSSRSIASSSPPAAFVAENNDERQLLDASEGVRASPFSRLDTRYQLKLTPDVIAGLADRSNGLSVMAEALSHAQALGTYHDLLRLFELAFALTINAVEKKLTQFLSTSNRGYTRAEVRNWFSFRDGATHGDMAKAKTIVLEGDIRPFIARMEQAAHDVLFNKLKWHDSSKERRSLVSPLAATTCLAGTFSSCPASFGGVYLGRAALAAVR